MTPFEISICQETIAKCWGFREMFERLPDECIKTLSEMTKIKEKYIREHLDEILA